MKKLYVSFVLILALAALAACGESKDTTGGTGGTGSTGGAGNALTVDSSAGMDYPFVPASLEASAGEVKVTFNNKGGQPHNWTLVKAGEEEKADKESVANAPDFKYPNAVAQTKLLQPGGSETVTAKLEPGTYTYLCTFPGHFTLGMKGTLVVK